MYITIVLSKFVFLADLEKFNVLICIYIIFDICLLSDLGFIFYGPSIFILIYKDLYIFLFWSMKVLLFF